MLKFYYEDNINDQEKEIISLFEKVASANPNMNVHDLMNALGVYHETKDIGKYRIGSGSKHIWISRREKKCDISHRITRIENE